MKCRRPQPNKPQPQNRYSFMNIMSKRLPPPGSCVIASASRSHTLCPCPSAKILLGVSNPSFLSLLLSINLNLSILHRYYNDLRKGDCNPAKHPPKQCKVAFILTSLNAQNIKYVIGSLRGRSFISLTNIQNTA